MAVFSICLLSLIVSSITNGIEIKISSDSLKEINNWDKTEPYLLGVFGTWGGNLWGNEDYQKQISEEWGVKMMGFNTNLGRGILPPTKSDAISCCGTTAGLKEFVQSSGACDNFAKNPLWAQEVFADEAQIDAYLYAHDSCNPGQEPTVSHCVGADNHGWGVPDNSDGWWNWMILGNIKCALERNPDQKYWHIWNEPNAVFAGQGATGEDYAQFYFEVAKAVKAKYPDIELAGPVTWCPPLYKTVFNEYFKPLMDKVVSKGRKDLLDYIDFHAYSNADEYNPYARWDFVVSSIHVNSLYWNGLTNGGGFIRSQMTETNVAVYADEIGDADLYWKKRVIPNAQQIMALSHNTDKFQLRIQFAFGAAAEYNQEKGNYYGFEPYTDKYMYNVIKPIMEGYPVDFKFTDGVKDGYPTYDNGDGVMAQTVYHDEDDTISVLLINYATKNIDMTLNDGDNKIIWDTTARFTRRWGPNTKAVTKSGSKATVQLASKSVTVVTGKYRSNPSGKVLEYEFGPMDESSIMQDIGYKTYDVDKTINIWINNKANLVDPEYAYIKFGLGYGAISDFKWTIKVKVGSTTYFTKTNFVPSMNFTQLPIESTSFLSKITKGNTVKIQFIGERTNYPGSYWKGAPLSGRIAFASLVVGGEVAGTYIKLINGVNLNKFYYAVKPTNLPDGITISWIKMKAANSNAWQLGTYNKNNKYYEWKDGPYTAPFDFQIKSTDGQIIYSWNTIDSLNDKDSGVMTQAFGSAYTEEEATGSGMGTTEYVAIVMTVLIVIGVIGLCVYCMMRKRKMAKAVSFEQETEDSKEKPMKVEGDSTPETAGNNTSGGYDMSPIDATGVNDEEAVVPVDDI
eukprot:CAMPEP_0201578800 /NCGR_PEP_ID=MMETSP0190_2-20130828/25860_1 /ASSEMBLY_ACC=CAM_ASM_000263 /TAXON_ID=37353 /ORGANISM="Rosalina sp." /LENGTH=849 /DNA_ID=CAMNT_0048012381 /DNA_START=47 /DNA_END=2596 /DNA_ORIENTATION=-